MLANPPVDPMASQNHVSIAFPQDLLKNQNGAYVGFLMPAICHTRELTSAYTPACVKGKHLVSTGIISMQRR
jgi:DNA-binding helix-hairpin-helix protein with protein kinase domain